MLAPKLLLYKYQSVSMIIPNFQIMKTVFKSIAISAK